MKPNKYWITIQRQIRTQVENDDSYYHYTVSKAFSYFLSTQANHSSLLHVFIKSQVSLEK